METSLDYINSVQKRIGEFGSVKKEKGNEEEKASEKSGKEWTPDDVFWVISVPEIWDDMSMYLMKDCAKIAGMKYFELGKEPIMAACAVRHTADRSELVVERGWGFSLSLFLIFQNRLK